MPTTIEELLRHDLLAWQAPGADAKTWTTRTGSTFLVDPVVVTTDIHMLRHCCISGLGIGLLPDAVLPDPGFAPDTLVHVMPGVVGRTRALRVSVPAALAEIPKVKMVLDSVRRFVGAL